MIMCEVTPILYKYCSCFRCSLMGVFNSNNYGLLAACRYVRSYYVYVLASRRINSKGSHGNAHILATRHLQYQCSN